MTAPLENPPARRPLRYWERETPDTACTRGLTFKYFKVAGKLRISQRYDRDGHPLDHDNFGITIDLGDLALAPAVVQLLARFQSDLPGEGA
jgi:hypothetical protein